MIRTSSITSYHWWSFAADTFHSTICDALAKAKALDLEEHGHECGHQFEISIELTGHSSGVVGEVPQVHSDANYSDALGTVTVRAHNLRDALLLAASLPTSAWITADQETAS